MVITYWMNNKQNKQKQEKLIVIEWLDNLTLTSFKNSQVNWCQNLVFLKTCRNVDTIIWDMSWLQKWKSFNDIIFI